MPKGEAIEQFAASMHLVLDLADKYPRESLAAHILDCVAQFLPASVALPMYSPWQSKADHLQRETLSAWRLERFVGNRPAFCAARNWHQQARVVDAENCARRGALSKAKQAVTSNSMPNANPCNIALLRAKHPEPAHPDRDPVSLSSKLWPRP
jgi:hypothetical protein